MKNTKPQVLIKNLDLEPHPEGGFYKEVYRSEQVVKTSEKVERSAGTGIYFMLTEEDLSDWHRVRWDELWHFYDGDDLMLEIINQEGDFQQLKLGSDFSDDSAFQRLVPQHCWQRAYSTGRYSLVGCTVSPGFEFEDFEMAEPEDLAEEYPKIASQIMRSPFG